MTIINRVELHEFKFKAKNLGNMTGANSVGAFGYAKNQVTEIKRMIDGGEKSFHLVSIWFLSFGG